MAGVVLRRVELERALLEVASWSCWFSVEPLPDDFYEIDFHAGGDYEQKREKLWKFLHPEREIYRLADQAADYLEVIRDGTVEDTDWTGIDALIEDLRADFAAMKDYETKDIT